MRPAGGMSTARAEAWALAEALSKCGPGCRIVTDNMAVQLRAADVNPQIKGDQIDASSELGEVRSVEIVQARAQAALEEVEADGSDAGDDSAAHAASEDTNEEAQSSGELEDARTNVDNWPTRALPRKDR